MRGAQQLRKGVWFFTRPRTQGVRAIPLTGAGEVVLVRHTYIAGWHLPGGGRKRGEDPQAAVLRELREEIGMTAYGEVRFIADFAHHPDFRRDTVSLFVVEGVDHVPRRSLEIEAIAAFPPRALPEDASASTRRRLAEWLDGVARAELW